MLNRRQITYSRQGVSIWSYPNHWDAAAFCLVIGLILIVAWGVSQMSTPYQIGEQIPISLNPEHLPYYALRSVLRMLIALIISLIFTFTVGAWAAKNKHAERIIIPMIDILQSVPILGFLTIATVAFIALFPHSLLGPECASIFVIFTSQVWNMTLSFYQSIRNVPGELVEATRMCRLNAWQRFWRLEVPYALPGLVWNCMMSMSASWFFVVASEAISVANQHITLPGIGSYIELAIQHKNLHAVIYAIIAMLIVIALYDQLMFRPLVMWLERFKEKEGEDEIMPTSWVVNLFQHTRLIKHCKTLFTYLADKFVNLHFTRQSQFVTATHKKAHEMTRKIALVFWYTLLTVAILIGAYVLLRFVFSAVTYQEGEHVLYLGLITGIRVVVLIFLSSLVWVPVGVWIGMRPRWAAIMQPIIQFLAAFPANLMYPLAVILILHYHLNVNIWCSPLMILGTQWYILFNVIAGASSFPKELQQAVKSFHVTGWLKWKRFILPGIFPFFATGAITAAGGAWNASILAEAVSWGNTTLVATGLGAYITEYSNAGDFPRQALGITVMCLYVLLLNRVLWRNLYNMAEARFRMEL